MVISLASCSTDNESLATTAETNSEITAIADGANEMNSVSTDKTKYQNLTWKNLVAVDAKAKAVAYLKSKGYTQEFKVRSWNDSKFSAKVTKWGGKRRYEYHKGILNDAKGKYREQQDADFSMTDSKSKTWSTTTTIGGKVKVLPNVEVTFSQSISFGGQTTKAYSSGTKLKMVRRYARGYLTSDMQYLEGVGTGYVIAKYSAKQKKDPDTLIQDELIITVRINFDGETKWKGWRQRSEPKFSWLQWGPWLPKRSW